MNPEEVEAAKQIALRAEFDWVDGMVWVTPDGNLGWRIDYRVSGENPPEGAIPDLTDSATIGCLRAMLDDSPGQGLRVANELLAEWADPEAPESCPRCSCNVEFSSYDLKWLCREGCGGYVNE